MSIVTPTCLGLVPWVACRVRAWRDCGEGTLSTAIFRAPASVSATCLGHGLDQVCADFDASSTLRIFQKDLGICVRYRVRSEPPYKLSRVLPAGGTLLDHVGGGAYLAFTDLQRRGFGSTPEGGRFNT